VFCCFELSHSFVVVADALSGYAQSKWVAEQLVFKSAKECVAYRVGSVAGRNPHDSINLLLRGVARLGCVALDCVPPFFPVIDCADVARGIVRLMFRPRQSRVFHFVSSAPLSAEQVFAAIPKVEADEFMTRVAAVQDPEDPLFFVRASLGKRRTKRGAGASRVTDDVTAAHLGARAPPVSAEQLWRYATE
jgi:thioester reductase-like protein